MLQFQLTKHISWSTRISHVSIKNHDTVKSWRTNGWKRSVLVLNLIYTSYITIIQVYGVGWGQWDQRDRSNFTKICCSQEKSLHTVTLYPCVLYTCSRVGGRNELAPQLHAPTHWNQKKNGCFLWTVAINDDILFRRCMIKVILIMNKNEINWRIELYGIVTLQHFARNTDDGRADYWINGTYRAQHYLYNNNIAHVIHKPLTRKDRIWHDLELWFTQNM